MSWFLLLVLIQAWFIARLVIAFVRVAPPTDATPWPKALAVMALRGTDPFLPECLRRLSTMDYPDYTLRLVIDSPQDPAVRIVDAFLDRERPANVEILYLRERCPHASGKVSGMLCGTENLPVSYEVVAFFDGDAIVHPTCLQEIVAPLMDPVVGVTSGNRWYAPGKSHLGAYMRAFWNAFAVPIMNVVEIPWGGCMAVRAASMRDPELRNRLTHAFGEDSTIATFMRQRGLQFRFVPQATIINRETISIRSFYNFLVRQLLTVRLHNTRWVPMFLHMLSFGATLTIAFFLIPVPSPWQGPLLIGFGILVSVILMEPVIGSFLVRRVVRPRGEDFGTARLTLLPLVVLALILTSLFNLFAAVHSFFARRHVWRGVTYQIGGDHAVTVTQVAPMTNPAALSRQTAEST